MLIKHIKVIDHIKIHQTQLKKLLIQVLQAQTLREVTGCGGELMVLLMEVMDFMNYYLVRMEKQYGILYIKVIDGG